MRPAYRDLLGAERRTRAEVYQSATEVWPTRPDLIEKDLVVCATLDILFGDVPDAASRLVFKGGTSLSKAHNLIRRFSEDVDLVIVRQSLGFAGERDPMDAHEDLSRKARERLIDELRRDCASFIEKEIVPRLDAALAPLACSVEIDREDPQTVLVHYPTAFASGNAYNPPTVKIEGGARSATLPAHAVEISPYVASVLPDTALRTPSVIAIDAERTFLDKLLILHGRHCHFRDKGVIYRDANRESRHYYDLAVMAETVGPAALAQPDLLQDVIQHSRIAFGSGWMRFDEAQDGELLIVPPDGMRQAVARDYAAMQGMILGDAPPFDEVLGAIAAIDCAYRAAFRRANATAEDRR